MTALRFRSVMRDLAQRAGISLAVTLLAVSPPSIAAPEIAPAEQAVAADTAAPATGMPAASRDQADASLESIRKLLDSRSAKRAQLKLLKRELKHPRDDSDLKEIESDIVTLQADIESINRQVEMIATDVAADEFSLDQHRKLDLRAEAEELVQPFVIMLKSATERARQIENLRRTLSIAVNQRAVAKRAIEALAPLVERNDDSAVERELVALKQGWDERLGAVEDLVKTTEGQLEAELDARNSPADTANEFARGFIRDRGFNLLKGLTAFFVVLLGLRFIGRRVADFRRARGMRKNLVTRVSALIFAVSGLVAALLAALVTFNLLNDWLLLGLTVVLMFALVWVGIRMLPSVIEQLTLYLNLGAVQEGERVFFSDIPWIVRRLDFYCDLYNPALEGGEFTVPIRELLGLHSRPVTPDESWFPTAKGDFVRLPEGVAKILVQTPGMVEVELEGGIRMVYPARKFFEMAPQNLSHGSRVQIVFGIGYRHQAIATGEFRDSLRAFVSQGLRAVLRPEQIVAVDVEVLAAGASSIDYEVECDMTGDAAVHFETVERLLARLCIDACNRYGWEIPFPQLVVHRPD